MQNDARAPSDERLIELLAAQAHDSWAGWTTWMLDKRDRVHEPSNVAFVERWRRQCRTAYADLSEEEKESDRVEARRYLAIVRAFDQRREPTL